MNDDRLVREELPIQSVFENGEMLKASVPVHLEILALSPKVRMDPSVIAGARNVVKRWYDEDIAFYLAALREHGDEFPWLRGYEKFDDDWELGDEPENGFLSLGWKVGGEIHTIKLIPTSTIIQVPTDSSGRLYNPKSLRDEHLIDIFYRSMRDPEVVTMSPEKLRKYGHETETIKIHESGDPAEVVGHTFCSDFKISAANTFLLRNFAVIYLNRLLDKARG